VAGGKGESFSARVVGSMREAGKNIGDCSSTANWEKGRFDQGYEMG